MLSDFELMRKATEEAADDPAEVSAIGYRIKVMMSSPAFALLTFSWMSW